jgi:hypothetical protein
MGDLFQEMLSRSRGEARVVQPRTSSVFEPETGDDELSPPTDVSEPASAPATAPSTERTSRLEEPLPTAADTRLPRLTPNPSEAPREIVREVAVPSIREVHEYSQPPSEPPGDPMPPAASLPLTDPVPLEHSVQDSPAPSPAIFDLPTVPTLAEPAPAALPTEPELSPSDPTTPTLSADSSRPFLATGEAPGAAPAVEAPPSLPEAIALPAAAPQRKIEVRISRIEVRAATPEPAPQPAPQRRRREPRLSLDNYLSQRQRSRGD